MSNVPILSDWIFIDDLVPANIRWDPLFQLFYFLLNQKNRSSCYISTWSHIGIMWSLLYIKPWLLGGCHLHLGVKCGCIWNLIYNMTIDLFVEPDPWIICILYLGMETLMLESTLQTRCTGLECIVSQMDTDMKELGMRAEGKGLVCTLLEMGRPNLGIGITGFLMSQAHRTPPILYLLLQFIIPEYWMQSRYIKC